MQVVQQVRILEASADGHAQLPVPPPGSPPPTARRRCCLQAAGPMAVVLPKLEAVQALGPHGLTPQELQAARVERARLTRSTLRLCFISRSQARQLAALELALLRSGDQPAAPLPGGSGKPAAPPSILRGCFCRFLTNKQHRIGRIVGTAEERGQLSLQMEGCERAMPLSCLSNTDVLGDDEAEWGRLGCKELQQMIGLIGSSAQLSREAVRGRRVLGVLGVHRMRGGGRAGARCHAPGSQAPYALPGRGADRCHLLPRQHGLAVGAAARGVCRRAQAQPCWRGGSAGRCGCH